MNIASISISYKHIQKCDTDAAILTVLNYINSQRRNCAKLRVRRTYKDCDSAVYWLSSAYDYMSDYTMLRAAICGIPITIAIELGANPFETIINSNLYKFGCEFVSVNIAHCGNRVVNCDRLARDMINMINIAGAFGGNLSIRRKQKSELLNTYWIGKNNSIEHNYIKIEYSPGIDNAIVLFELGRDPLGAMLQSNVFDADYARWLATA